MKCRVLIADNHPLILFALRSLVDMQEDLICAGAFDDLAPTRAYLSANPVDLLVTDLSFNSESLLPSLAELIEQFSVRVVVTSALESQVVAPLCLAAGAHAFVSKNCGPSDLLHAIRFACREATGGLILDPLVAPGKLLELTKTRSDPLSTREWDVLAELSRGSSTTEISQRLFVSPKTIETHRTNLKRKLGMKTANELVSFASTLVGIRSSNSTKIVEI